MRNWVVSIALAALVMVLLYVFGSSEAVTIIALMCLWFAVVGGVALLAEMAIQALSRALRR